MAKGTNTGLVLAGAALVLFLFLGNNANADTVNIPPGKLEPSQFVQTFLPYAQQVEQQYGVPADTCLGQSGLETGWGNSEIAKNANNYFGIEADASWGGDTYTATDGTKYRKYASVLASFLDYGAFLRKNVNYKPAFDLGTGDPVAFASAIATGGYAEDPNYLQDITETVQLVEKLTGGLAVSGKQSHAARNYISHKIKVLIHEGYAPAQAEAIAYDMARAYGYSV